MESKARGNKVKWAVIEWEDSQSTYGWQPPLVNEPSAMIVSVGLLVDANKKTVTISTSKSSGGRYVDSLTIPRSAIISLHIRNL